MITKEELRTRIQNACDTVMAAEAELTEIDSRFGDADHGFTMAKVCNAILAAIDGVTVEDIKGKNGLETLRDVFIVFVTERDVETIFRPGCEARSK